MPEWKSPEAFQRLLAAMVAAADLKLDYRKIATYYGEGATYDSIEGRFRIVKRDARKLKEEIDNGTRAVAPPRGSAVTSLASNGSDAAPRSKKATSTTSKPKKERVLGGRVTKAGVSNKGTKGIADAFGVESMTENLVQEMKQETVSSEEGYYGGEDDEAMGGLANDGYGWMMDSI